MNVWTVTTMMLWVIPVFWLISDFDTVVDNLERLTGRSGALVRGAAVLSLLLWPVAMIIEMVWGDDE